MLDKKRHALRKLLEAVEHELLKKPNRKTLDRLSLLAGFQDWDSFQEALHGEGDGGGIVVVGVDGDATNNCSVTSPNNFWICGLSSDIKLMEVAAGVPEGCFVVIPSEQNKLSQADLSNGATLPLYASLKAKKVKLCCIIKDCMENYMLK